MKRRVGLRWGVLAGLGAVLLAGCATIGPRVSSDEIKAATEELRIKTLLRTAEQQQRVWSVGYTLVNALPADERHHTYPELGLAAAKIEPTARAAFHYPKQQTGVCVLAVREGGPAQAAGIRQGDILLAVNGSPCSFVSRFLDLVDKLTPGQSAILSVRRGAETLAMPVVPGSLPIKIVFKVSHDQAVNAWARGHEIGVTNGLLRFVESKDELAVILGHELAHITGGHRGKGFGTTMLSSAVGITLGLATEIVVPGAGSPVMNVTSGLTEAAFSRNFEREADYKGLLHAYRAGYDVRAGVAVWERFATDIPEPLTADLRRTHPSSPERMVRMRKIAQSLADHGLEATIAAYEPHTVHAVVAKTEAAPPVAATPAASADQPAP